MADDDIEWVEGIPFKKPDEEGQARPNNPDGKDLRLETARWIKANPELADLFLHFAKEMSSRTPSFGIGLIAERVRWQVVYDKGKDEYKVNNNYRAYIARWIIAREPSLEKCMTFRTVRY